MILCFAIVFMTLITSGVVTVGKYSSSCPKTEQTASRMSKMIQTCPSTIKEYSTNCGRHKGSVGKWEWHSNVRACIFHLTSLLQRSHAQACCLLLGATLLKVDSQAVHDEILEPIQNHVWLALNDIKKEGLFVWNNETAKATYTNWLMGRPKKGRGGANIDCVVGFSSSWMDVKCSAKNKALCHHRPPKPEGRPELTVSYASQLVRLGTPVNVSCTGLHGRIFWTDIYGGDLQDHLNIAKESRHCVLHVRSTVTLKMTIPLIGKRLKCCVVDVFDESHMVCNESSPLDLTEALDGTVTFEAEDSESVPTICPEEIKAQLDEEMSTDMLCNITDPAWSPCGQSWQYFAESHTCVKELAKPLPWVQARNCCEIAMGAVVEVPSASYQQLLEDTFSLIDKKAWLGPRHLKRENHTRDDEDEEPEYSNFEKGHSENSTAELKCVVKEKGHNGLWKNTRCDEDHLVLCQKKLSPRYKKPFLSGNLSKSSMNFLLREVFNVTCFGTDSPVTWFDGFASNFVEESLSYTEVDDNHNCHKIYKSQRFVTTMETMQRKKLRCCLDLPQPINVTKYCEHSVTIMIVAEKGPPLNSSERLNVTPSIAFVGEELEASCERRLLSPVPLSWIMLSQGIWTNITKYPQAHVTKDIKLLACKEVICFRVKTILNLLVSRSMAGAKIACTSSSHLPRPAVYGRHSNTSLADLSNLIIIEGAQRKSPSKQEDDPDYESYEGNTRFYYGTMVFWILFALGTLCALLLENGKRKYSHGIGEEEEEEFYTQAVTQAESNSLYSQTEMESTSVTSGGSSSFSSISESQ